MKLLTALFFTVSFCSFSLDATPSFAQQFFSEDTNGDGVVDQNDDWEAIEAYHRKLEELASKERDTAEDTKLVPGLYVSLKDDVATGRFLAYLHAISGNYCYHHFGIDKQWMDVGKCDVKNGWLKINAGGIGSQEIYLHPQKLSGRDVLLTQSGWASWNQNRKLGTYDILIRIDKLDIGKVLAALPTVEEFYDNEHPDQIGPDTFDQSIRGLKRDKETKSPAESNAESP
ncbi:hypothetical protein [Stieleria varia]|uniref:EF-hand domain-containing protein n=1 Tax=Stieleria varia TaxID=2528005 RepID=A0A5C6ANA0_9BACT|nr:hypothetical protein [Stieleria varia]TWU00891.1 hypothetical protein Pla52n_42600 [Stieleria varia]